MHPRLIPHTLSMIAGLSIGQSLSAAPIEISNPVDQEIYDQFLKHAHTEVQALSEEHFASVEQVEDISWIDFAKMEMSLAAFEFSEDLSYLQDFVDAFDRLNNARLVKDRDGLLGWRGPAYVPSRHPDHPLQPINEIQTEFRGAGMLARFVELLDQSPKAESRFGELRESYLDLAENHLVKKWDVRGAYVDLGTTGAIYRYSADYKPDRADITLPHEKQGPIIETLLRLYRVTGNDLYMRKAIKMGTWLKHVLALTDGRYTWSYWSPVGEWDIDPDDSNKWKHWIGNEPKGVWYSVTVGSAMLLYQHGFVFDQTDLDRFLKTQLEVCWDGDLENRETLTVLGHKPMSQTFVAPSLAPFDERIEQFIFEGTGLQQRLDNASSSWKGGVNASDWLFQKHVMLPVTKKGIRFYQKYGDRFLASPENAEFVKELKFEVTPPGRLPPQTPTDLNYIVPASKAPRPIPEPGN